MRLNYKRLGDYIEPCNEKNDGNVIKTLQGISNRKYFQKAKTNTIGVDLSKYRVVRTGQFAFNRATTRNGDKISIALRKGKDCIVSPSYRIFKSKDENILNSEYLMMWFKRPDFDRYARFKSHGSAHEFFDWDEMQEVELPIPSIEKQNEIVAEYNTIVNRIKLNEQLNQKLEDTAQALYKHWFVDFEFPNTDGKPYKSSGGEMIYNEELDMEIPEGWEVKGLSSIADYLNGAAMQKYPTDNLFEYTPVLKIRELNLGNTDEKSDKASKDIPEKYKIYNGDVIFSWSGTLTIDIWTGGYAGLNQHLFKVSSNDFPKWFYYLATKYYVIEFIRIAEGNKTSMGHIKREHLDNAFVTFPKKSLNSFNFSFESILNKVEKIKLKNNKLIELKKLLLSKMTNVDVEKEMVN
ncbi:Type I restriction-modification system, specificity subunit S [Mesoflavibacter sp. HG96]|uniref:restriction endonuclease subunit S n=1 Tax=unclassified Mesoflavibacter TaxID=2630131 RepID=UPI000D10E70A|nr:MULTISPECIES: restriction endonuclease subunit S [unclassified Mesoflavibacter]QIJ89365.1 Type I restriction-modification system, specificity subunit S [Mesoflavibacter sp. HG96]QIJ92093.1 Type I restriction-modification system, specificity subunit S [Mesoflavibacter sp. HG37]